MTVFTCVTLPLCIVAVAPAPARGYSPPPSHRYKIAPSHSTVSQSQTSARERDRIAHPHRGWGVDTQDRGRGFRGLASDPGEHAPIVAEIGSLEHSAPSSVQTRHTGVIASRARAPGHGWREDVTVSHTSEVSLHGNCV